MSSVSVGELSVAASPATSASPGFFRRLLRRPLAIVCLAYLGIVVLVAIIAPLALPGIAHEQAGDLLHVRQGPSWDHLLGTDALGRDILDRLLVGTRVTMIGVAEALVVALALGVPLGLAAGYLGGKWDRATGWLTDLTLSMPSIAIVLVVLAVFPHSMFAAMVALGVLTAPALGRIVRSATLPVREELYIAAARVSGLSRSYIIGRHVLPRVAGAITVLASLFAATALLAQTGLAYLGLIVTVPQPSWGGMVGDGIASIDLQPWLIWPPGIVMTVTIVAFGLLGDAVRDANVERWSAMPKSRRKRRPPPPAEEGDPSEQAADSLLSVEGLSIGFPTDVGQAAVIEDVSFRIASGEIVGILGESGCGKTVTGMSLLGLVPGDGEITRGRIVFDDRELTALSEAELRRVRGREIALISQEPTVSLNPAFRVGYQLELSLRVHHGVSRGDARRRALDLLRQVHLPEPELVARRYPHELSGGMAQRVAIARALAGEPKLLIADEPTTALDVTVQAEILDLVRELQRQRSMAVLLITHDWGVIADLCDRVIVMYAGQIVEQADLLAIFQEPRHPYTQALLASDPHHTPEGDSLPTIAGSVPAPGRWPAGCHFHPRCRYAGPECRQRPIALERPAPGRLSRCIHHEQLGGRIP